MDRKPAGRVVKVHGDGKKDINSEAARYNFSKQRRQQGLEGKGGEKATLNVKDVKVRSRILLFSRYLIYINLNFVNIYRN